MSKHEIKTCREVNKCTHVIVYKSYYHDENTLSGIMRDKKLEKKSHNLQNIADYQQMMEMPTENEVCLDACSPEGKDTRSVRCPRESEGF